MPVIRSTVREKHKPVRVKDPSSKSHSVCLVPDQKFEVFLSNSPLFAQMEVAVKSDFLEMEGVFPAPDRNGRIYCFRQRSTLENWGRVSTTFLGEIQFKNLAKNFTSRLCVFLNSSNPYKKNIVTVINPNGHTVKVQPFQIIEVVLYSPVWGRRLYWEWDNTLDPRLEPLCWNYICPSNYNCADSLRKINDAFFTYPRCQHNSNQQFFEYHFWFRCDPRAAKHIHKLPEGFSPDGVLRFNGIIGMETKTTCDLNLAFNPRRREDPTTNRVQAVTFEDSDMTRDVGDLSRKPRSTGTSIIPYSPYIKQQHRPKVYGTGSNYDWASYNNNRRREDWYDHDNYETGYGNGHNGGNYRPWCSKQKMVLSEVPIDHTNPWKGLGVKYLEDITNTSFKTVYAL